MNFSRLHFVRGHNVRSSAMRSRSALTVLEMMVSVTLLAVIMVGLLAMFQHTQKALHIAHSQTDVFENARAAIQIVSRDLSEMTAYDDPGTVNSSVVSFYGISVINPIPGSPPGTLPLITTNLPVDFNEAFWLTRKQNEWRGIGYYVDGTNLGVGTLYRFLETTNRPWAPVLASHFTDLSYPAYRVSDGIVHFRLTAVYPETNLTQTNFVSQTQFTFTNVLPAFVDVEMGILEPATLKQFQALADPMNTTPALTFLRNNASKVHFFRERVPIRNFVNPHRAHEVF